MRRFLVWTVLPAIAVLVLGGLYLEVRQQQGKRKAQQIISEFQVRRFEDIGATRSLKILPLIEYHTADPDLLTEVGVSYLVETDQHRILFDVGQNARAENPSPLQRNMQALGVDLADIDLVFISHNHFDHVGGQSWAAKNTFSLGTEQLPFPNPGTEAIVPDPMTYPGLNPVFATEPMLIGNGVGTTGLATTGVIPRQLAIGWIEEHSLVINVQGLGGVLIVGCGHQTLPNLLQRYHQAYSEPLYGIIGGLHFPVPDGRIDIGPINAQRRFASGDGLFSPLGMDDVHRQLAMLEQLDLGVIGIGGHDSSDEVIAMAKKQFGEAYRYVRVGEQIVIRAADE